MGKFDSQIASAKKSIGENGQWVLWNRNLNGVTVDPNSPWLPSDSASLGFVVKIVFVPVGLRLAEFIRAIDQTEVKTGRLKGLMAGGLAFAPDAGDSVNRDGVVLQIESIDTLAPNGQVILYTVFFKG